MLVSRSSSQKQQRHKILLDKIKYDPFLTDEELADFFKVSVPTIRLDRLELGIPELRERIKNVAETNQEKLKSIEGKEFIGELIDLQLGQSAISLMETNNSMAFEKTHIIRGHYIYSLAETLAIAVIDAQVALVGIANIKYKIPVYSGAKIVAKAEVKENKRNRFIVWVKIYEKNIEVFRGKFTLVSMDKSNVKVKEDIY